MLKVMKQLSVHTANRPGVMAEVTRVLTESDVNIVAILAPDTPGEYGTLRILPDDPKVARTALEKLGLSCMALDVLVLELPHRPGSLAEAARLLAENDLVVRYAYASIQPGASSGLCILRLDDIEKGREVLEAQLAT